MESIPFIVGIKNTCTKCILLIQDPLPSVFTKVDIKYHSCNKMDQPFPLMRFLCTVSDQNLYSGKDSECDYMQNSVNHYSMATSPYCSNTSHKPLYTYANINNQWTTLKLILVSVCHQTGILRWLCYLDHCLTMIMTHAACCCCNERWCIISTYIPCVIMRLFLLSSGFQLKEMLVKFGTSKSMAINWEKTLKRKKNPQFYIKLFLL